MSRQFPVAHWARPARMRAATDLALCWLPLVLVLAAAALRWGGPVWAIGVAIGGGAILAAACLRTIGRLDQRWLVRRLDAREGGLEDSAGLLLAPAPLSPFRQLQRERIERRLAAIAPETLADAWSVRTIAAAWLASAVAIAALLWWPEPQPVPPPLAPSAEGTRVVPGVPRLTGQRVRIVPPAYTGMAPRWASSLDVRAPAGSRVEWALAFAPQPPTAALQLLDGQRLPLSRTDETWTGSLRLDRPLLYRVTAPGMRGLPPLHRLEPIADAPPQVRLVEPAQGLVMVRPGQRSWHVVFEATDDYAVAASARLTVTVAQGEGENVTFRERSMVIGGSGPPARRRFVANLGLAEFGLQPGGDLVAQLTVSDTRSPGPQPARGPGAILRWPAKQADQPGGLELMTKRVLPAYFRSQRQIIIDAEALLAERRRLAADTFLDRSDVIGADQRLLRLRYGQFLGEEQEGAPKRPALPTNDAPNDAPAEPAAAAEDHGDDHDHAGTPDAPAVFGQAGDVTAAYGHVHDEHEAATLLDPDTRATLKQALDQMWQSELNLRQGKPDAALPYAYQALKFIKEVQQATRIFLARVGPQLPPLDLSRRMTGKREGIAGGSRPIEPFVIDDAAPADAWRQLASPRGTPDLFALDRWVRGNTARIRDPLALLAAIDGVRNDPACARCRVQLSGQLWAVLTRPPAQVRRRADGGVAGQRYLRGLR